MWRAAEPFPLLANSIRLRKGSGRLHARLAVVATKWSRGQRGLTSAKKSSMDPFSAEVDTSDLRMCAVTVVGINGCCDPNGDVRRYCE